MSRRRRAIAATAVALVVLVAVACSSDDAADDPAARAASAVADVAAAGPPPPPLAPGQVVHDIGTSFQYQSFVITVGHAIYDPDLQQLTLGLRYRNVSGGWAQTNPAADLDLGDGTSTYISGDLVTVPPGVTVDLTAVATSVPEDPTAEGVVTWGSASFDQPVFRLDGSGGDNLWLPADVAVDGWAQIGKFAVHLTGARVNAAEVDMGIQADPGQRVLRVFVEEYTTKGTTSPFSAAADLLLKLPSGELLDAVHGSPQASQLSWTSQGGQWADFAVPADLDGDYELQLASIPKVGFGTLRPELIERRPIPFELRDVGPGPEPEDPDLAWPAAYPPPTEGESQPFDADLEVGSMNVPGYDVRPTHLAYDPTTMTATLDATITSLVSTTGEQGGILSSAPTFGLQVALVADGRLVPGALDGDATLDAERPTDLTFQFDLVRKLAPDAAGLYIGPSDGAVSSMPLGPRSDVASSPPPPIAQVVDAPEVVSGDWTVQLKSYRVGLFNPSLSPEVGRRQLEISMTVTASPSAQVKALGLGFSPVNQVLLASGTGYDTAPVADSGYVEVQPGQTVDLTVTFDVADTFQGGRTPIVVRSRAEFGELLDYWVDTRFVADLTAEAAGEGAF